MNDRQHKKPTRQPHESASDRLARLLTMVPWLLHRPGIEINQAAKELHITRQQLEADLALLFLCGTPGGMPDDLIEAEWEEGRIYLSNADTISRPLRLSRDEALTLIIALRTLAEIPGPGERDPLNRTLAKLEEAISSAAAPTVEAAQNRIQINITEGTQEHILATARQALHTQQRIHLRYLVAARDETTERDVDPMRITSVDGRAYLEGWCHRSDAVRLFRLDRVEEITLLNQPGTPPQHARPRDVDNGIFQPGPDDLLIRLELTPTTEWMRDYYPHVSFERLPNGKSILSLHTADVAWLRRLLWSTGGTARVLEPTWLADEIAQGAREALAAYSPVEDVH
ncbi:helix-turn-helix transcriptional regulator [Austwickia chelonae]|uniref:helix-turn-helix transcriptional regulator n=1 Tax=Austwickia chelonae TaxID=100225 RepID=UPI000E25E2DA|nr:WYL domain-containing protein [Austwickia chelonae]